MVLHVSQIKRDQALATPVQYVKGVGPVLSQKLAKLNIFTVLDLFYHIPIRYVDRRKIYSLAEITEGKERTVVGTIRSSGPIFLGKQGRQIYEVVLQDATGKLLIRWFRFYLKHMKNLLPVGKKVLLAGDVSRYGRTLQMTHPDVEVLEEGVETKEVGGKILPIYPLTEGLSQKTLRKIIRNAWDVYGGHLKPTLPSDFMERYQLSDPWASISLLHFPSSDMDIDLLNARKSQAHRTLIFDEFFFLELGLALKKANIVKKQGIAFSIDLTLHEKFLSHLPFEWTSAQSRVIEEIFADMRVASPMNRLLQGDVGSGKTVVALASSLQAMQNGLQTVLMAPTEILAEQHFENIEKFLKPFPFRCCLLTSSIKGKHREEIYFAVAKGEVPLMVGTHALIQEGLEFKNLGLVIIDEQHRFGVLQRQALHKKGMAPDVLVMTATPIPRTLAMTAYGDLDVSVIDELPKERKPVLTRVYGEKQRSLFYQGLLQELEKGRQAFVVYPLIEESEKMDLKNATEMSEELARIFEPKYRVMLLHGRLPFTKKEAIMKDFKEQKIHILATTSLVEVGVDCPNASVMVVEHAERFGLSQLHQLRGRVGRSQYQSYCILMADYRRSEEAKRRLKIMVETHDGFKIAEEDLAIRGPGEFLGTRQAGMPDFKVANLARDLDLLSLARKAAFELIGKDPNLSRPEHQSFREILKTRWTGKLELVHVS